MDHINASLKIRLNQKSLATTATAAYVCHAANELSSGRYQAVSFKDGMLTLAAPSSAAAQDLKYQTEELLTQINNKLNASQIKSIRIRTGRV